MYTIDMKDTELFQIVIPLRIVYNSGLLMKNVLKSKLIDLSDILERIYNIARSEQSSHTPGGSHQSL